ncbi:uncharacterized protein LOC110837267 isoform X2 [Zootermopsis nevadensis]|uniref:Odorant receptor n=1 Tax=Zootermopsis nevadensis TaxID=136037 RepID=A0A067QP88_ZOONE|nr:uncharacterized protein LOC110837267 isoform X2 [Zootermopsis nevadensis]KDR11214.1 hypothetical protein L798_15021 [Zootermopsis nevadensis]
MKLMSPRMKKILGVEEHREAKELLEFNLRTLRILGLWKWDVPHWRYHKAFAFLAIIALILFNITQICDVYIHINSIEHITKLLLSIVFSSLVAFKNCYLLLRSDDASELIDQLQNKFFTSGRRPTPQQTIILNRYAARAKLYTIIRTSLALCTATLWILSPIKEMLLEYAEELHTRQYGDDVKSNSSKMSILKLPFVAYYPFDVENNFLYFILTYIYQAFCGLAVFISLPTWDMLFVSVFIHTSGHFKALQHVLIHLREDAGEALEVDGNQLDQDVRVSEHTVSDGNKFWTAAFHLKENYDGKGIRNDGREMQSASMEQKLDRPMQHILKNCVQHHQVILSFVKKLEAFLKPVMLMQLLGSVIAYCVLGFQMSVIPIHGEGTKFVTLCGSFVSALLEQGMFYWFGGELLEASSETLNAAYHCEWYTTNIKFRKHLHILMERAKRQVKLTAGGFSTLTLENFTKVIQSSYQYFAMLKAVHNKDTD